MEITDKIKELVNDVKVMNNLFLLHHLGDNWLSQYISKNTNYDTFTPDQLKSIYTKSNSESVRKKATEYYTTYVPDLSNW